MNLRRLTRLGLISISSLIAANSTMANEVADFYKGKRITMWIGYSSGGGYDRYARTLARHMG